MRSRTQRLGQHFLRDPNIVRKIIALADIQPKDTVVEIGPGQGILTRALSPVAGKVFALEIDHQLYQSLKLTFGKSPDSSNIEWIHADALDFPWEKIPKPFKVVANLPYSVSTPILFRLLEMRSRISRMILMFQLEVARRIVAQKGGKDYGVLSISTQFYADPRLEFIVPRGCFSPKPRVDSAVVHLKLRETPRVPVKDEAFFFRVVRAGFAHRRKSLRNALKDSGFRPTLVESALEALARSSPTPSSGSHDYAKRRAETLGLDDWSRLADKLFEISSETC